MGEGTSPLRAYGSSFYMGERNMKINAVFHGLAFMVHLFIWARGPRPYGALGLDAGKLHLVPF